MPERITLVRTETAAAELAEGLLDAGVLREADWRGRVGDSVHAGLVRWVNQEMKCEEMRHIHVGLTYTDRAEQMDLSSACWVDEEKGKKGEPVGLFGLWAVEYDQAVIGGTAGALNEFRPERELGYQVMGLIDAALWRTVRGATPAWAAQRMEMDWEAMEGEPEEELEDALTPDLFFDGVPKGACVETFDLATLREGLEAARAEKAGPLVDVLETAIGLAELLPEKSRNQAHSFDPDQEAVLPLAVRWSEDDDIGRVSDDHHEMIAQSGYETDLLWCRGFQLAAPGSLRSCIDELVRTVAIVRWTDGLLSLMTGEAEVVERVRVAVTLGGR